MLKVMFTCVVATALALSSGNAVERMDSDALSSICAGCAFQSNGTNVERSYCTDPTYDCWTSPACSQAMVVTFKDTQTGLAIFGP